MQHPPAMTQPFGVPQFAPDSMQKRSGGGLTKALGIVLLILAMVCVVNGLASLASGLTGGGVPPGSFANLPKESQVEMERITQEIIDRALARWSFWANGGLEVVLAALSALAGIALLRGKLAGIKLTLARCGVAVFLLLPVSGIEGFTQMTEVSQMMRILPEQIERDIARKEEERARRAAPPSNAPAGNTPAPASSPTPSRRNQRAAEMANTMEMFMKGFGYGMIVLMGIMVFVLNGVLALLVTRPKVREYLEFAHEGGDMVPHFNAAMGLNLPPPAMGQGIPPAGPGAPTVMIPPGSLNSASVNGPGAPTVALPTTPSRDPNQPR